MATIYESGREFDAPLNGKRITCTSNTLQNIVLKNKAVVKVDTRKTTYKLTDPKAGKYILTDGKTEVGII